MYMRLSSLLFPVAAVLLLGALYWGYQEHQEKNSILIKAENQYQRAFHDLSYHIDKLHSELGNTLAVSSKSTGYQRKGLVNVWRISSQAQSEINQLPLTLLPFNNAEDFLARISNFSYLTSIRDLTKQPLTDKETKTLNDLYKRSEEISSEMNGVRQKVLAKNLRWMDVELALASENEMQENSIIDGLRTVDGKITQYSEMDFGPTASVFQKKNMTMLSGSRVTAEEVRKKAAKLFGFDSSAKIHVVENGKGTDFKTYSVSVKKADNATDSLEMDFSQKGGHLVWFLDTRKIGPKKLSIVQGRTKAEQFLKRMDYQEMTPVSYDPYGNVIVYTFARKHGNVVVYPEAVTVKMALDNGEVIGLQAKEYIYEHRDNREIHQPKITQKQAKAGLNPNLKVESEGQAIIKNDLNTEVQCYEFIGRANHSVYRIYVNADTGEEEKVEDILPHETQKFQQVTNLSKRQRAE